MAFIRGPARLRKQIFLNFKGGTGKTTLAAIYGLRLAELGYRTLFIDMDPQGHLTTCLGKKDWHFDKTLFHVLVRDGPIGEVTKKIWGLPADVVPADISLSATELCLGRLPYREWRLVHALAPLKEQYDVVVMDTSPTIGLLTLNGLLAAEDLIIPVLPDSLSMLGLETLFKALGYVQRDFRHFPVNVGVLLNRFEPAVRRCINLRKMLAARYPQRLLKATVRECPELANQPSLRRLGGRYCVPAQAAEDIDLLIEEIAPGRG